MPEKITASSKVITSVSFLTSLLAGLVSFAASAQDFDAIQINAT